MMKPFNKLMATVVICSLLSTPGYSVMNPQDAPVEFDRKILVTSAQDDSGQKIIVMSTPDDENQKIIAMISSRDEEQKILINTIDKDLQDEGQRIYANLFQSGGIRVLSFKEVSSLLSPIFSPDNKIYFGKGYKAEDDTDDHDEKIEISIPSGEKERVPVDVNIMTRTWYDNYLRGQDTERQKELMNDIQYQIENLDENEKYVWVEKIKGKEVSYQLAGDILIDKKTGGKMFIKLLPMDENSIQKFSVEIFNRYGDMIDKVTDIPYEGALTEKIKDYVKKHTGTEEMTLKILLGLGNLTFGGLVLSEVHTSSGLLLGIILTLGTTIINVKIGKIIGQQIHAKQYHNHIRHLFDRKAEAVERRIRHKHFRSIIGFLSQDLLETKDPLQKENERQHQDDKPMIQRQRELF